MNKCEEIGDWLTLKEECLKHVRPEDRKVFFMMSVDKIRGIIYREAFQAMEPDTVADKINKHLGINEQTS
jgi:hypothetical protein